MIEIAVGYRGTCPKCAKGVKGVPDNVSSGQATAGARISFADFHQFIVAELAHLAELEINGLDCTDKKNWLTDLLPLAVIEETLEKAKKVAESSGLGEK